MQLRTRPYLSRSSLKMIPIRACMVWWCQKRWCARFLLSDLISTFEPVGRLAENLNRLLWTWTCMLCDAQMLPQRWSCISTMPRMNWTHMVCSLHTQKSTKRTRKRSEVWNQLCQILIHSQLEALEWHMRHCLSVRQTSCNGVWNKQKVFWVNLGNNAGIPDGLKFSRKQMQRAFTQLFLDMDLVTPHHTDLLRRWWKRRAFLELSDTERNVLISIFRKSLTPNTSLFGTDFQKNLGPTVTWQGCRPFWKKGSMTVFASRSTLFGLFATQAGMRFFQLSSVGRMRRNAWQLGFSQILWSASSPFMNRFQLAFTLRQLPSTKKSENSFMIWTYFDHLLLPPPRFYCIFVHDILHVVPKIIIAMAASLGPGLVIWGGDLWGFRPGRARESLAVSSKTALEEAAIGDATVARSLKPCPYIEAWT